MGMFDMIRSHYPLPLPEMQDRVFQTKSLNNCMEHYLITEDGRLVIQATDIDQEEVDFTGTIRFYDWQYENNEDGFFGPLIDFVAFFDQGKLISIRQLPNIQPST